VADTDTDSDGTPDCKDECLNDATKTDPGVCGCGVADTDTDGDGTPDCNDTCLNDPLKSEAGLCGCGVADTDSDGDGTPDCNDLCPLDVGKIEPGVCGCAISDADLDKDGAPDCIDECVNDPNKTTPGFCGCGIADFTCISSALAIAAPTCVSNGGLYLSWTISNPNSIAVPVSYTKDGAPGSATIPAGGSISIGNTPDGPSSHSVSISWPGGGSASVSSTKTCGTTPTGGGGTPTGIIPVTGGAGGPTEPLIIPVTGVDYNLPLAGLQKLFMYMGLMLFGVTMMLEGFDRRRTK
jgi:hypothetical protein